MALRAVNTAHTQTPTYELSDVSIIHYAPTQTMVFTRIVQNTIVDCLYICATRHCKEEVVEQIKKSRRVGEFLRSK